MIKARCSILASLPLPDEVPNDMLSPLMIPAPYTFQDYISSMPGVSANRIAIYLSLTNFSGSTRIVSTPLLTSRLPADRSAHRLVNYRVFYALTTVWCPAREEHGYLYTPVFKCSTNPRVSTAHRWSPVDPISKMNKPTGMSFFYTHSLWF
jgi:hypothetical protein